MDLQLLLHHTSRTFALAIPLLPEPPRTDVSLAYLVFRILDSLEDCESLPPSTRRQALLEFIRVIDSSDSTEWRDFTQRWAALVRTGCSWHDRLLVETPTVLQTLHDRDRMIRRIIELHARRTAKGMMEFLRGDPSSLQSLRRYCYFVAGIVGEMLTDIFAEHIRGFAISEDLYKSAKAFGEGLQLTNILRDATEDARRGRSFLPLGVDRGSVLELARQDLQAAEFFVHQLQSADAPPGYLAFCCLPLELAWATLDLVERVGPGCKVPRGDVARILDRVTAASARSRVIV